MRIIKYAFRGIWYYVLGHLIAARRYDKKYLKGRWFKGKKGSFGSVGWQWVVSSARARRKYKINTIAKFPVSLGNRVVHPENIEFHPDDLNNFQSFGIYYQAIGKIKIGKGTLIGPNVGLITANHDLHDLDTHDEAMPITIGKKCWIGMNAVILPGVTIGDHTIVGAGAVVTKSFPQGNCVIAGNPAKVIKELERV